MLNIISDNKNVLRYIVAFYYVNKYDIFDEAVNKMLDSSEWLKPEIWLEGVEQDVYEYIANQFDYRGEKNNVGVQLKYSGDELPCLRYYRESSTLDEPIDVQITDVGIYIFRSGVGFLWYEVDAESVSDNVDSLITFQNNFKELNRDTNFQRFRKLSFDGESTVFSMGEYINSLLAKVPLDIHYFSKRKSLFDSSDEKKIVPDKAILFTYFASRDEEIDNKDNDSELIEWTYYLTNGYNRNFMLVEDIENSYYHPFKNVYWNITNEGCACCVKYNHKNAVFFTKQFAQKCCADYFLIYILILHQAYSLLNYATWIEENLSAESDTYEEEARGSHESIEKLQLSLNTFFTKNIYASVSHIQHQNDFYLYGLNRFNIDENIKSVSIGADAINDILERKETRREAEDDSRRNMLFGILSFLVIFSALADADALFNIKLSQRVNNPVWWIVFGVIVLLALVVFKGFQGIIAEKRRRDRYNLKGMNHRDRN